MFSNPFSLGWGAVDSSNTSRTSNFDPRAFGALPSGQVPESVAIDFVSTTSTPDILNCRVVGPDNILYFLIRTSSTTTTLLLGNRGDQFASIHWQERPPIVHADNLFVHDNASKWVILSADKRRRKMTIRGQNYYWIPHGHHISLYGDGAGSGPELARITRRRDRVTLQMTMSSFVNGLFEPSVLATTLFLSGRNID